MHKYKYTHTISRNIKRLNLEDADILDRCNYYLFGIILCFGASGFSFRCIPVEGGFVLPACFV